MQSVNIFNSDNSNRVSRVYRNGKIIYNCARIGTKVLEDINPVTVGIDAIISVGEAIISFYEYQKEKEVTKQLQIEYDKLCELYELQKREYDLIIQATKNRNEIILQTVKAENSLQIQKLQSQKIVYSQSQKFFLLTKERLEDIKRNFPTSSQLKNIEKKYMQALNANLSVTLKFIGG